MIFPTLLLAALANGSAACSCESLSGGMYSDPPILVARDSRRGAQVLACGSSKSEKSGPVEASEFGVFTCERAEAILTFTALDRALLRVRGGSLEIVEVESWPFGPRSAWIDVPTWRHTVRGGSRSVAQKVFVFDPPKLSRPEIEAIASQWDEVRSSGRLPDDYETFIGRLLAAALSGEAAPRAALTTLNKRIPLDGHSSETWHQALSLLAEWEKHR